MSTLAPDKDLKVVADHHDGDTDGGSSSQDAGAERQTLLEESEDARIQRLGWERPAVFTSLSREIAFNFSISMSQILTEYYVSGFMLLIPTLTRKLNMSQSESVWPTTAFSLVVASTLLVFGRLGDMWGGYPVYLAGIAWLIVWSVAGGFSPNPLMLNCVRALQGLGAAAFIPTGIMLLGSVYRPGPRKNLAFALYAVCAVLGFFFGIFFAGIVGKYLFWGWYFWIGAILSGVTLLTSVFSIPNDRKERLQNKVQMDWLGSATIIPGLILLVFSLTESAHTEQRWRTPHVPVLFTLSLILLSVAAYIEGWVAKAPLLPPDIFAIKGMAPLSIAICLLYGTWGIYMFYGTSFWQNIMGAGPLQVVAWYIPTAVGGIILTILEGFIMHVVSGQLLLIISVIGCIVAQLLLAFLPSDGNYWAWIFPSTVAATIGIDMSFVCMTVFVTTKLPVARQGLAGGFINSVLQLGIALILGFSDIIQAYTEDSAGLEQSYRNTFHIGTAIGVISLIIVLIWGQIPRAASELTADERAELLAARETPQYQTMS